MRRLCLLLLLTLPFLFAGCDKDKDVIEPKTAGELTGEAIESLAEELHISKATTYMMKNYSGDIYLRSDESNESFSVEGQIIKVGNTYYNLDKLVKYEAVELEAPANGYILEMYFEGMESF
ncbi:hypothetical protein [Carboxylicivirga linearis]|uniref:Uncharacterized protein n=1 Tax=Carboxylicivirga linearis TaxID=1628157 RepID=A0ABS5JSC1_9BACT|nr:hypothetical protein [Carboxylicivirga linearis]MBS2097780.1 hypothetical protein [Carboxylicivirga linearis]